LDSAHLSVAAYLGHLRSGCGSISFFDEEDEVSPDAVQVSVTSARVWLDDATDRSSSTAIAALDARSPWRLWAPTDQLEATDVLSIVWVSPVLSNDELSVILSSHELSGRVGSGTEVHFVPATRAAWLEVLRDEVVPSTGGLLLRTGRASDAFVTAQAAVLADSSAPSGSQLPLRAATMPTAATTGALGTILVAETADLSGATRASLVNLLRGVTSGAVACRDTPLQCSALFAELAPAPMEAIVAINDNAWSQRRFLGYGIVSEEQLNSVAAALDLSSPISNLFDFSLAGEVTTALGNASTGLYYTGVARHNTSLCKLDGGDAATAANASTLDFIEACDLVVLADDAVRQAARPAVESRVVQVEDRSLLEAAETEFILAPGSESEIGLWITGALIVPFLMGGLMLLAVWIYLRTRTYRLTSTQRRIIARRHRELDGDSLGSLASLDSTDGTRSRDSISPDAPVKSLDGSKDDETASRSHASNSTGSGSGSGSGSSVDASAILGNKVLMRSLCVQFVALALPVAAALILLVLGTQEADIGVERQRRAQAVLLAKAGTLAVVDATATLSTLMYSLRSAQVRGNLKSIADVAGFMFAAAPTFQSKTRTKEVIAIRFMMGVGSPSPFSLSLQLDPKTDPLDESVPMAIVMGRHDATGHVVAFSEQVPLSTARDRSRASAWSGFSPFYPVSEMAASMTPDVNVWTDCTNIAGNFSIPLEVWGDSSPAGWHLAVHESSNFVRYSLPQTLPYVDLWSTRVRVNGSSTVDDMMAATVAPAAMGLIPSDAAIVTGFLAMRDETRDPPSFSVIAISVDSQPLVDALRLAAEDSPVPDSPDSTAAIISVVAAQSGHIIASSDEATAKELMRAPPNGDSFEVGGTISLVEGDIVDMSDGRQFKLFSQQVRGFDAQLAVQVALPVDPAAEAPNSFASWFAILQIILIVCLVLLLVLFWRRSLADSSALVQVELKAEAEEAKVRAQMQAANAQRALAVKSRFISVMSHELRNPLTGVTLNADLLLSSTKLSAQAREYVHGIARSSKMMLTIINDVLDVSKIESGRLTLERVVMNIREIVSVVAKTVAPAAARKGVSIGVYFAPNMSTEMLGDPTRLRQILYNLAVNALQFTETGHVIFRVSETTIESVLQRRGRRRVLNALELMDPNKPPPGAPSAIPSRLVPAGAKVGGDEEEGSSSSSAASTALFSGAKDSTDVSDHSHSHSHTSSGVSGSEDGTSWDRRAGERAAHYREAAAALKGVRVFQFEVIDTGVGVDEEGKRDLFREFAQVEAGASGGTGLGLFICKKLVEMHGGYIQVESIQGRGSVFTAVIPFRTPSSQQLAEAMVYRQMGESLEGSETSTSEEDHAPVADEEGAADQHDSGTVEGQREKVECGYLSPVAGFSPRWRVCIGHTSSLIAQLQQQVVETTLAAAGERAVVTVVSTSAAAMAFLRDAGQASAKSEATLVLLDEDLSNAKVAAEIRNAKDRARRHKAQVGVVAVIDCIVPPGREPGQRLVQSGWDFVVVRPVLPELIVDLLTVLCRVAAHGKPVKRKRLPKSLTSISLDVLDEDIAIVRANAKGHHQGRGSRSASSSSSSSAGSSHVEAPTAERGVVLVVDDFDLMREVVSTTVRSLNYHTLTAADGSEAVAMATDPSLNIVAIFMDCEMPVMDGFEATRAIRAFEAQRNVKRAVPIIACTGNAMQEDRRKCMDAGMSDFASKPLQRGLIENLLNRYVVSAAPRPSGNTKTKGGGAGTSGTMRGRKAKGDDASGSVSRSTGGRKKKAKK
jgi:signal transduction histidine kinase/CheY-like chemotaxis protein